MIRDDWLLRSLRQATSVLARVRRAEVSAEAMVPGALLALTGLGPRVIERLPPEALRTLLRGRPEGATLALLTGALLAEHDTSTHRRLQALTLLADGAPDADVAGVEPKEQIARLLTQLSGHPLTPHLHAHLFRWFVHAGELDRADDHLHAAGALPGLTERAREVLEPLREWPAERLEAAGWSRAELEDVLGELD